MSLCVAIARSTQACPQLHGLPQRNAATDGASERTPNGGSTVSINFGSLFVGVLAIRALLCICGLDKGP